MTEAKRARKSISVTTTPQFNVFEFKWVLEKFQLCKNRKLGSFIDSPVFTVHNNQDKFELQLKVYRSDGIDDANKGDLRVILQRISSPTEPKDAHVTLSYFASKAKTFTPIIEQMVTIDPDSDKSRISLGWAYGLKWSLLQDRGFVSENGDVTIKLLIRFDNGDRHEESADESNAASAISKQALIDAFGALHESKKFSDVVIVVGDKKFPAHKAFLASRSSVFSTMLESPMKESRENVIEIGDVEPDIMAEMLRFVYTGKVENMDELAADLLVAADMYQLEALRIMCEETLARDLSVDNVVEILKIVDRYDTCRLLRDSLLNFLVDNGKEVLRLENIDKNMKTLSPTLLFEINKALMMKL